MKKILTTTTIGIIFSTMVFSIVVNATEFGVEEQKTIVTEKEKNTSTNKGEKKENTAETTNENVLEKAEKNSLSTNINGWEVVDEGSYYLITKYTGISTEIVVPPLINGKLTKLSNINKEVFPTYEHITSFKILPLSNGVKVGLKDGVNSIGDNGGYVFDDNWSKLDTVDLSGLDTSQLVDMSNMFNGCVASKIDLDGWNTSNVTRMTSMFSGCNQIKKLDLGSFDTSKVTNMTAMFKNCANLINLNVSSFNTRNVINMRNMFEGTSMLQLIDLSNFEISSSVSSINWSMFRTTSTIPLTVIAKDSFFFNYQYDIDKRKVNSILLNANGGTFSDGSMEKNYFTSCAIRPEETSLDKLEEFKQNNLPTKTGFLFNGYTTTTDTSQATSVLDLIGTVYDAQWKTRTVSLEVPTTISFGTHKLSKGTNYYSVDTVEGTSLSVTDDRGIGSKWQLTAKLQTPFTNNGKTLSNSLVYKTSTGEETITENVAQIIATHTTGTDSEKTVVSDNWTNAQGLMLKLEEGKAYAGEYSGTIEWTLNVTP
ncbi:BspA family leucine-rich repeat surface protein [Enterococcus faecalis]|uniref:BspA family leucine-rich repeat surface protein n=3 Tax=Enterococcus faecalis TaxID=1351 RepID=UPI001F50B651|nr:BspA family leucine-rich repeat surface protein [Enterococcus faecalis]